MGPGNNLILGDFMKYALLTTLLMLFSSHAYAATFRCIGEGGELTVEIKGNRIVSVKGEFGPKQPWNTEAFTDQTGTFYNFFYMPPTDMDRTSDGYTIYTIFFKDEVVVRAEAEWTSNDHDGQMMLEDPACTAIP